MKKILLAIVLLIFSIVLITNNVFSYSSSQEHQYQTTPPGPPEPPSPPSLPDTMVPLPIDPGIIIPPITTGEEGPATVYINTSSSSSGFILIPGIGTSGFISDFGISSSSSSSSSGSSGGSTQTYVLIDGNDIGIQIHVDPNNPTLVEPKLNPTTEATGVIDKPGKNCKGDDPYYTGMLFGFPKLIMLEECGFGHVVKFENTTDNFQITSAAYMREWRALLTIDYNGDLEKIVQDLNDSISDIRELQKEVSKLSDAKVQKEIQREIKCVLKSEQLALELLEDLKDSKNGPDFENQIKVIRHKIAQAKRCKKMVLQILRREKLVLKLRIRHLLFR